MKKICYLFLLFCIETTMAQENQQVYVALNNRQLYSASSEQYGQGNVKGYVNYVIRKRPGTCLKILVMPIMSNGCLMNRKAQPILPVARSI